ncbi:YfiR family protein [Candidatus Parabeggiatoa sp. HSG14]|uniref:YfiR family protein n=1 Tax=Candidatus Parabeggiatoa sp. HSG14 TaxID=3055593 RepID=UPI0025A6D8EE|nr:YfiR family protein [Thiotrichales bacterium HSG14]
MSFHIKFFRVLLRTQWLPRVLMLLFMCGWIAFTPLSHAQTDEEIEEYQIKAVYLFNFANFFTWPSTAFQYNAQPFRICVLGNDPFGIDLDLVIEDEEVEGREVVVQRIPTLRKSVRCQILFVSQSERAKKTTILNYVRPYPILTVGDMEEFATRGGMVEFFNSASNEVRFSIAPETVKKGGLIASSNLLEIAKIIRPR